MNRRAFLAGALVSKVSFGAPEPIIDTHTHFFDPNRKQGVPWPPKTNALLYRATLPGEYAKMVRPLGVTGTVVVEASPWLEDNQWVLDLAKDHPMIVGLVGHLDAGQPGFRQNLSRFQRNPLFRGIRLGESAIASGLGEADFVSDLKALADADLSLDAIGNSSLFAHLLRLSRNVPTLRIIVDHMPMTVNAELREIHNHPQIYSKVSGVLRRLEDRVPVDTAFYRRELDQLWDVFGPDRLVYGSNWPVSDRLAPYGAAFHVGKEYFEGRGKEASEKYFWKNAAAFYKWVSRG